MDGLCGQSMGLLIGPVIYYLSALDVFLSLTRTQFLTCKNGDNNVHFISFKGRENV